MDEKKVIAKVSLISNNRIVGSHGHEEPYDPKQTIDGYIEYFTSKSKRENNCDFCIVEQLDVTLHEESGSFQYDNHKNRLHEVIYKKN